MGDGGLPTTAPDRVLIEPPTRWAGLGLHELWEYRELFITLAVRDLKVRYKQAEMGAAWAVLQPLLTMVIFTIVFGKFAGFSQNTGDIPYPIFTFAALVPWTYFSNGLGQVGNSMVSSSSLITKVYFPRIIIPISSLVTGLVDMGISFVVLLGMMLYYRMMPTPSVAALPVFIALATGCALGVGLWLAALNVEYRDVRYVIPFLIQAWMWLTPIAYPVREVPVDWRLIYSLNPMVGVIEGFRWSVLGHSAFPGTSVALSALMVLLFFVTGLFYFRRMEKSFADVV